MVRFSLLVVCCVALAGCNLSDENPPLDGRLPSDGTMTNNMSNNTITPGCTPAEEICDGIDNDCDAEIDEGCDDDGDGFCDNALVLVGAPEACVNGGGDCDDDDAANNPRDTPSLVYIDRDGDGYGTDDSGMHSCAVPPMRASQPGDCRDDVEQINPGASELCDNLDNNCNEEVDEGCDDDGDDYCDSAFEFGANLEGNAPIICPLGAGDCQDDDPNIFPGQPELCDGVDNDCDEVEDNGCDEDGDGYCDSADIEPNMTSVSCPMGGGDCDDNDFARNPGAMEICGFGDLDCDDAPGIPNLTDLLTILPGGLSADNAAMATDGADTFALAWVQDNNARDSLAVATFDPAGAYKSQVFQLTDHTHGVLELAIAWDETSQTFAVAYVATDAVREQTSLYITRFDRMGMRELAPTYVDEAAGAVYLSAMDGKLVVLYDKRLANGDQDIMHASMDVVSSTVTSPVSVIPGEQLGDHFVSHAQAGGGRAGGILYIVRQNDVGGQYESAVIYGDDGSKVRANQTSAFIGGSVSPRRISTPIIDGRPFLLWIDRNLGNGNHQLLAAELNSAGFPVADRFIVLQDVPGSCDYEVLDKGNSEITLFYEDGGVKQTEITIPPTIGSSWSGGVASATPMSSIPTATGRPSFFASAMNQSLVHLSQSDQTPNFFTWYNFRETGAVISTVGPVLRLADPRQGYIRGILYDEADDAWQVLFSDATAQTHFRARYSFATGFEDATQFPASPQPCAPQFDGRNQKLDCVQIEPDNTFCDGFTFNTFTFSGMRWTTEQIVYPGSLDGLCAEPIVRGAVVEAPHRQFSSTTPFDTMPGDLLFVLPKGRAPLALNRPLDETITAVFDRNGTISTATMADGGPDGVIWEDFMAMDLGTKVHFIGVRGDEQPLAGAENLQLAYGTVDKSSGAISAAALPRTADGPADILALFQGADLRDDKGGWVLYKRVDGGREQLRALRVDDASGLGTTISILDVPRSDNVYFGNAAIIDGQLVVTHIHQQSSGSVYELGISRYAADGTEATTTYVEMLDVSVDHVAAMQIFGSSDYMMVAIPGNHGIRTLVLDSANSLIGDNTIVHAGTNYNGISLRNTGLIPYPLFDGEGITMLANDIGEGSLVIGEGFCAGP